jgi:Tol biopolymer transport system component
MSKVRRIKFSIIFKILVLSLIIFSGLYQGTSASSLPKIVFISDRDGNSEVYISNLDGSNAINLTNNPANDLGASWLPDGSKISFASDRTGNLDIFTINADGTNLVNVTNSPENEGPPIYSPDSSKFITGRNDGSNYSGLIMNADGTIIDETSAENFINGPLWWSSDSTKVVGMTAVGGYYQIYTMNSDGTNQQFVTSGNMLHTFPTISPDGTKIAYFVHDGNISPAEIYVANFDGTNPVSIAVSSPTPSSSGLILWSPDGSKLLYSSDVDGNLDVYSVPSSGGTATNLTNNNGNNGAIWLNNSQIILESDFSGNKELYIMNSDGTGVTNITSNSGQESLYFNAVFMPQGTSVNPNPPSSVTPTAPKTGKLIGATIATAAILAIILLLAKEVKDKHHSWAKEK